MDMQYTDFLVTIHALGTIDDPLGAIMIASPQIPGGGYLSIPMKAYVVPPSKTKI